MSLRPSKRDDHKHLSSINDRAPSHSRSQQASRRASSAFPVPSRVPPSKSNEMTFSPTHRPKLTSHPSGSSSNFRTQRPKLVSRPSGSASTYNGSMRARHGSSNPSSRMDQNGEEEDDGSVIIVKVPKHNVLSANSSDVDLSSLPTGQLVKRVSKALSVDNLRGERSIYDHGYVQGTRCSTGTELKGLMEVMSLESLLLLLKKYLNLYHDFDEASGEIFIRSTHEEFFTTINQTIVDIAEVALYLGTWSFNRSRRTTTTTHTNQAFQIQKTLRTAYEVRATWIHFFDWKLQVLDPMVREQQECEGWVRRGTWRERRKRSAAAVEDLLGLLADVEIDEGREGVLDMQKGLRKGWKEDGLVGVGEAERRGWVCGVGV